MKEYRKTAVDLTDLAIGVVVLGVCVSIGATILINLRNARLTDLTVQTTTGENVGPVSDNGVTSLSKIWAKSLTSCINATSNNPIGNSNITFAVNDYTGVGTVRWASATNTGGFNNSNWNCTYTWYNTSREDYTLANQAAIGLGEYGNWFKIIVIVGVAAAVDDLCSSEH